MMSSRLTAVILCACASGIASFDAISTDARALKEEEVAPRALDIDVELDDNATNESEPIDEVGCLGDEERDCCRLYVEDGEAWKCATKKAESDEGMDEAYCEMKKGTFCKESKVYKAPKPGQAKITFSMDMDVGDAKVEDLQKDETFLDSLAETMMVKLNVVRSAVKVIIKEKVRRLSGGLRRLSTSITVDYEVAVDEEEAQAISATVNDLKPADVQSTLKEKLTEKGSPIADAVTVQELTSAEVEVITASPTKAPTPRPPSGGSGSSSGGGGSSSGGSSGDTSPSPPPPAAAPAANASTNSSDPAQEMPQKIISSVTGKSAGSSPISIAAFLVALVAVGSAHVA